MKCACGSCSSPEQDPVRVRRPAGWLTTAWRGVPQVINHSEPGLSMPWTGKEFASRHNKALKGARAKKAASIASAIVRGGGDEGIAIATANKYAKRHRGKVKPGAISEKVAAKHGYR